MDIADIDLVSVDHVLMTTRAVRKRLDLTRPVEREVIEECINIAIQAPTGGNDQGWHFVVVTDAATITQITTDQATKKRMACSSQSRMSSGCARSSRRRRGSSTPRPRRRKSRGDTLRSRCSPGYSGASTRQPNSRAKSRVRE